MRPLGKPNDPFAHVGFRHFREKNNSAVIPITRITALYCSRLFTRCYLRRARYLRTAIWVTARPDALRSAASAKSQIGGTDEAGVLAGGGGDNLGVSTVGAAFQEALVVVAGRLQQDVASMGYNYLISL